MSRVNYDDLISKHPNLAPTIRRLVDWIDQRPNMVFFELSRFARTNPDVDAFDLAAAIRLLVEHSRLVRAYRVLSPDGSIVGGNIASLDLVPEEMPDRTGKNFFSVTGENIVSGLSVVGSKNASQ